MNRIFRDITLWIRVLIAATFIFSAISKAVDPVGGQLKIEEYLNAWGLNFLSPISLTICFIQIAAEALLGFSLLYKIFIKKVSVISIVVMSIFTLLTLYITLTDSVSDCGCFGEIVNLSNRQTFFKNIILLLLTLIIWSIYRKTSLQTTIKSIITAIIFSGIILWGAIWSHQNLPLIDATNLCSGTNIPQSMEIPDNAQMDRFRTELHYRNIATGKIHIFDEQDTTWWDSSKWEFVDTRSILVEKGFRPEIENFKIFDNRGEVTDSLFNLNEVIVLTIRDLSALTPHTIESLKSAEQFALNNKLNCILLTCDPAVETTTIFTVPTFRIDATTLKTLLRTTTGIILLNNGTIEAKWSIRNMPDWNNFNSDLKEFAQRYAAQREVFPLILVLIFIVLIATSYKYVTNK